MQTSPKTVFLLLAFASVLTNCWAASCKAIFQADGDQSLVQVTEIVVDSCDANGVVTGTPGQTVGVFVWAVVKQQVDKFVVTATVSPASDPSIQMTLWEHQNECPIGDDGKTPATCVITPRADSYAFEESVAIPQVPAGNYVLTVKGVPNGSAGFTFKVNVVVA